MITLSEADRAALLMMFPHLMNGEIDGGRIANQLVDRWYAEDYWNDNPVNDIDGAEEEMDR
jgi:hypothetical protein